jgi:hypothetical protein
MGELRSSTSLDLTFRSSKSNISELRSRVKSFSISRLLEPQQLDQLAMQECQLRHQHFGGSVTIDLSPVGSGDTAIYNWGCLLSCNWLPLGSERGMIGNHYVPGILRNLGSLGRRLFDVVVLWPAMVLKL